MVAWLLTTTPPTKENMDTSIWFSWNGNKYTISHRVYDEGKKILLPDGTLLQPMEWLESYPVQLGKAEEIPNLFKTLPIEKQEDAHGDVVLAEERT